MISRLKEYGRFDMTILLIVISMFSFGLSVMRFIITDTKVFLFLNWNLFLAFIPWFISSTVIIKNINNKAGLLFLILSWLLFFPNSPYILTDLFHLRARNSAPIWYDLIVILSFAWAGLLYGFISLMDIEKLLQRFFNKKVVIVLSIAFLFLGSFGIYLGRFLRWNSWDIIRNPGGLFSDIIDRFLDPASHPGTWGMTILMGILLNLMYFSFKLMKSEK